jgi:hypothetical protein
VRSRKYICLNLSPRAAKVLLLARLMKAGLFDAGYISFGGFDETKHSRAVSLKVMLGMIAELPGFGPIAGELMPYVYEMTRLEPMLLGEPKRVEGQPQHVKKQAADRQFDEYSDSFFTIVTETELNSRRISEKPLKSLVNFQPSIILGNPGSVAFTRELGFQSFDGYVDEAYDTRPIRPPASKWSRPSACACAPCPTRSFGGSSANGPMSWSTTPASASRSCRPSIATSSTCAWSSSWRRCSRWTNPGWRRPRSRPPRPSRRSSGAPAGAPRSGSSPRSGRGSVR